MCVDGKMRLQERTPDVAETERAAAESSGTPRGRGGA